ncbi:3-oxoadipyl-CoA thiolase [Alterisphingorhabdus coralli]|uniref:3-oxoadipyl-CoA thiolase n=1 Tax=Alterisphingorhabdus coralli TaxID=3071408 RepID=A0AA97I0T7_9SPHN|nr:3-oxoadipyl-CoA thiolase [Parasphingorhabdus sp. SCSIO 66989]WOE75347.1 3-oxoadipyl-CoA thiolase [Parasphingorhabdus sp. SCSIO 66989]
MTQTHAAFLCENKRTAIGRYGGILSSVRPDDLAAHAINAVLTEASSCDPNDIDDIIFGCANQAGEDNRNVARMAALLAGLPETVPGVTVNRLCASGLNAVASAAQMIRSGDADLVLAGGVESMSRAPFVMAKPAKAFSRTPEVYDTTIGWRFINPALQKAYGTDSMPETGENVAADFDISRKDQDAFALRSQQRAARAQQDGRLGEEIAAIEVRIDKRTIETVTADEHPRADTSLEKLARLPTPFRENGTVTAGNSSGVNDGAAAMLVASETAIQRHGLTPLARIVGFASAGIAPRIMGFGPVGAVEALNQRHAISTEDYDVIELNEAFASQALAVLRQLGVSDDADHVNPNGGAIALGHPLGMSGARIAMTAARELKRRKGRLALATMCVGVGQGAALALEAV